MSAANGFAHTTRVAHLKHQTDLEASGLTRETWEAAGVYTEADPAKIQALLGWQYPARQLGACLVFPYRGTTGAPFEYVRIKPEHSRKDREGKLVKYEAPKGKPPHAYFPQLVQKNFEFRTPLIFTEGEKKALCACQHGFATIGLSGVWSWKRKGEKGLLPELTVISWENRQVLICFDSDRIENENVRRAEVALATALARRGAVVRIVELQPGPNGEKTGIDDFFFRGGTEAQFKELLDKAQPPARDPKAKAAGEDSATAAKTGAEIILDYFKATYKPKFRRGNAIHGADGRDVPMLEATGVPTSPLIVSLSFASDAPKGEGGVVKKSSLPRFFSTWAKVAWGDLLRELPDEDEAKVGADEPTAELFRQLVREAMLSEVVLGQTIGKEQTRTERRSLIDWCRRFAETGPWRGIRSKKCWCKERAREDGEVEFMVAIRHELFSQLAADKRLRDMGANRFSRRAERYGVGVSDRNERPHGQAAIVLNREFVEDLIADLPDPEASAGEAARHDEFEDDEPTSIPFTERANRDSQMDVLRG